VVLEGRVAVVVVIVIVGCVSVGLVGLVVVLCRVVSYLELVLLTVFFFGSDLGAGRLGRLR
jgi:hypothetical protein